MLRFRLTVTFTLGMTRMTVAANFLGIDSTTMKGDSMTIKKKNEEFRLVNLNTHDLANEVSELELSRS